MTAAFCTQCGTPKGPGFACAACAPHTAQGGWDHGVSLTMPVVGFSAPSHCETCGGDGRRLKPGAEVCAQCGSLAPLKGAAAPPLEAFLWRLDAEAMTRLQNLGPLTQAVHAISGRVGRPWLEAAVDGVRLSPRQLPDAYAAGVRAARLLGLARMPALYVGGQDFWGMRTLGTQDEAFIVIGAAVVTAPPEVMLFLLAREMGRVRAGHAVWRTAFELLAGPAAVSGAFAGQGLMQALNPARAMQSLIQAPLAAWARQAEITADRAGCLAVGDLGIVRRSIFCTHLRSPVVVPMLDMADWQEQEDASERSDLGLAEATMSATPFLTRRLKLARVFMAEPAFAHWRKQMAPAAPKAAPASESLTLSCPHCATQLRVARTLFERGEPFAVRCASAACAQVFSLRPKAPEPLLAD